MHPPAGTLLLAAAREKGVTEPGEVYLDPAHRSSQGRSCLPASTSIFTLSTPRAQEDWPEVHARAVPKGHESLVPLDAPLGMLGKALFAGVLALGKGFGAPVPEIHPEQPMTGAQATAIAQETLRELFPHLQEGA
jgi:hypothetical protein